MKIGILLMSSAALGLSVFVGCSNADSVSSRPGYHPSTGGDGGGSVVTQPGSDGGGGTPGIGPGDAGTTPLDPDAEPPPDPNACNFIDNSAALPVTTTNLAQTIPVGLGGGQPLDGAYPLTAVTHYGNAGTADTYKATAYLSAGNHQYVMVKNGGSELRTTMGAEYVDTTLTLTGRCGSSATQTLTYTTINETQIIVYDSTARIAYTYTRPEPAQSP